MVTGEDAPVMMPPAPTLTLERGEVVVTAWPFEFVLVMTAAGTLVDVVKVLPWALVVVTATSTLVGADVAKADDVRTTTLPSDCVDDTVTGTITPLAILAVLVVLRGSVVDETMVLPAPFVVVIATVVEEPWLESVEDVTSCELVVVSVVTLVDVVLVSRTTTELVVVSVVTVAVVLLFCLFLRYSLTAAS